MSKRIQILALGAFFFSPFVTAQVPKFAFGEFLTLEECLEKIQNHSEQSISKTLVETNRRVSGFLANGAAYSCNRRQLPSGEDYWSGWYDVEGTIDILDVSKYEAIPDNGNKNQDGCSFYLVQLTPTGNLFRYIAAEVCARDIDMFYENEVNCADRSIRLLRIGQEFEAMTPQPSAVSKWFIPRRPGSEVHDAIAFVCGKSDKELVSCPINKLYNRGHRH